MDGSKEMMLAGLFAHLTAPYDGRTEGARNLDVMMTRDMSAYVSAAETLRQLDTDHRIQPALFRNVEFERERLDACLQRVRTSEMTREPALEGLRAHQPQRLMEREHTGHRRRVMVRRVVPEVRCQRGVEAPVRRRHRARLDPLPGGFGEREQRNTRYRSKSLIAAGDHAVAAPRIHRTSHCA